TAYVLTDGSGPTDTSTLTITVSPVNDHFTDANEVISVAEDSRATTGTVLTLSLIHISEPTRLL
uniref:hypothetical protein n=1 Tax=Shewanella sp. T24-MNA-CIBAN-0130 TaxID=3140470 RepID=UPI0033249674